MIEQILQIQQALLDAIKASNSMKTTTSTKSMKWRTVDSIELREALDDIQTQIDKAKIISDRLVAAANACSTSGSEDIERVHNDIRANIENESRESPEQLQQRLIKEGNTYWDIDPDA